MRVCELIELLGAMPQEMEVRVDSSNGDSKPKPLASAQVERAEKSKSKTLQRPVVVLSSA